MSYNVFDFSYFYIKSEIRPFGPKHAACGTKNIL